MLETPLELTRQIGQRIRQRRAAFCWTQADAASRAGVAYRTWRRLEAEGKASLEDMVKAAVALRAEEALSQLFRQPEARNLDELLARQRSEASSRKGGRP